MIKPRTRLIHPGLAINEELAKLSDKARIFFPALWCVVDREGRIENKPDRIKLFTLPYDKSVNVSDIIKQLEQSGFLLTYTVDGVNVIQITNWLKYQTPHLRETSSVLPEQPKVSQRLAKGEPKAGQGAAVSVLVSETVSISDTVSDTVSETVKSGKPDVCVDFMDQFNVICKDLPKVQKLTKSRIASISKRVVELTETKIEVATYMNMIAGSDFLCGRNGNTWNATFDWILKPVNFQKILEGNYDDRSQKKSVHGPSGPTTI